MSKKIRTILIVSVAIFVIAVIFLGIRKSYIASIEKRRIKVGVAERKASLKTEAHFSQGIEYYNEGKYNEAIKEFQKVIDSGEKNMDVARAWMLTGRYYEWEKDWEKTLRFYQKMKDRYAGQKREEGQPDFSGIAQLQINSIKNKSDYDRKPLNSYVTADRYFVQRKYQEAIQECKNLLEKFPKAKIATNAEFLISKSLFSLEEYDAAIKSAQELIERYPNNQDLKAQAYFLIGSCYERQQEYEKALKSFQKVRKLSPNSQYARVTNLKNITERQIDKMKKLKKKT